MNSYDKTPYTKLSRSVVNLHSPAASWVLGFDKFWWPVAESKILSSCLSVRPSSSMNNRKNYFGYHCASNVTWSDAVTPSVGIHCGHFNSWVLGFGKFWRPLAKSTEFCQSISQTVQSDEQTAKCISVIIALAISRRATQSLLVYMLGWR